MAERPVKEKVRAVQPTFRLPSGQVEALKASEINALILEENLVGMRQVTKLVTEMRALRKPVYYVEPCN